MAVLFTSLTISGLAALLYLLRNRSGWTLAAKAAASAGFIGVALAQAPTSTGYLYFTFMGLGLGFVGDLLLARDSSRTFVLGLLAFLFGHVAYLVAYLLDGPDLALVAIGSIVMVVIGIRLAAWLLPHVPANMGVAIRLYMVIIAAMTAASIGLIGQRPLATIGAVAFFLSDIAVARDRFVQPGFANKSVGLPLYYLGQLLIAWSI